MLFAIDYCFVGFSVVPGQLFVIRGQLLVKTCTLIRKVFVESSSCMLLVVPVSLAANSFFQKVIARTFGETDSHYTYVVIRLE